MTSLGNNRTQVEDECCAACSTAGDGPKKKIKILTFIVANFIEDVAREFEKINPNVEIDVSYVYAIPDMFAEVMNEATSKAGLYDGFVTLPLILGSAVQLGAWRDLTPDIRASKVIDWPDVLLAYREQIAQFEGNVYMYPFDGDLHSLFYRKDVLEEFGLSVPKTWQEYNDVAKAVHGKTFINKVGNETKKVVLSGSCVGRVLNCAAPFYTTLVHSSMTQARGTFEGSLFDTNDMKPLAGEALEETIRLLEGQVEYGAPNEFEACLEVNQNTMNEGTCVLTYNWGFSFKNHMVAPSEIGGKMGVATAPGSTSILNRKTMKLEDCTQESCPHGQYYEDVNGQGPAWVNVAPYPASGGWSGAISSHAQPEHQQILNQFFEYACSFEGSIKGVIPNVTDPASVDPLTINVQDPWRKSHLDLRLWQQNGYEAEAAKEYRNVIVRGLESPNLLADIRFPSSDAIMAVLDEEIHDYLLKIKAGKVAEDDRKSQRTEVANSIVKQWEGIITSYDAREDVPEPLLTTYQRLRGVYFQEVELNQLTIIRPVGWALAAIIISLCIFFGAWTFCNREKKVVKSGQPLFLGMVILGCYIMGSAIFPMGVDDSIASVEQSSMACQSIPWLVAIGFTTAYSALFAKIWRVKQLFEHSRQFRRIQITEKDVLPPFAVLLTLNIILLLVWTLTDPFYWKRVFVNETNSYGICTSDGVTSIICASLILAINILALILANVQAYKTRKVEVEYAESSYIAIATLLILQVLLVGVPLIFLVRDNPTADFFIKVCIIFFICTATTLLIFVPKFIRNREIANAKKGGDITTLTTSVMSVPTGTFQNISTGPKNALSSNSQSFMSSSIMVDNKDVDKRASYVHEIKSKIDNLEKELQEQGIDSKSLFKKVGLWEGREN